MHKLTLSLLVIFIYTIVFSQDTASIKKKETSRGFALFSELGGPSGPLSLNFDFRLKKTKKGLGMRLGTMIVGEEGKNLYSVPIGINWIGGRHEERLFEFGINYTFTNWNFGFNERKNILSLNIGYRYSPLDNPLKNKKLNWRISYNPMFQGNKINLLYFGISLGFNN